MLYNGANRGGTGYESMNYGIMQQHGTHIARNSTLSFSKSSRLVFIGPMPNETDTGFPKLPEFSKKYIDDQTVRDNPYISQHQTGGFC